MVEKTMQDGKVSFRTTGEDNLLLDELVARSGSDRSTEIRAALRQYYRHALTVTERKELLSQVTIEGRWGETQSIPPHMHFVWYRERGEDLLHGWVALSSNDRQCLMWLRLRAIASQSRPPRRGCLELRPHVPYSGNELLQAVGFVGRRGAALDLLDLVQRALQNGALMKEECGSVWFTNWDDEQGHPEEKQEQKERAKSLRVQERDAAILAAQKKNEAIAAEQGYRLDGHSPIADDDDDISSVVANLLKGD